MDQRDRDERCQAGTDWPERYSDGAGGCGRHRDGGDPGVGPAGAGERAVGQTAAPAPSVVTLDSVSAGGTWSVVPSPNTADPTSVLSSVACVSASDCWAVGDGFDLGTFSGANLIEHWDGSAWGTSPGPDAAGVDALSSVTCLSASDCWAVGGTVVEPVQHFAVTLTEHWDGSQWSIVASSDLHGLSDSLDSVSCVSGSDCWAVGDTNGPPGSNFFGSLIEHWDGSSWSVAQSDGGESLYSVTCVSATDCWAAGDSNTTGARTLTEHWDGSAWAAVTSPDRGVGQSNLLTSVTCASTADCWAVGSDASGVVVRKSQVEQTLALHWDGSAWSIVATPDSKANQSNYLASVTCAAPADCWAVGSISATGRSTQQTLVVHWDGSAWTIVPSESLPAATNDLSSVACADASDCWSVGSSIAGTTRQTLTERLTPTAITVTPGSGPPGTTVSVQGTGFTFGKHVKVAYLTGTASGRESLKVCSDTAGPDGSFACSGTIPVKNVGAPGPHVVEAVGPQSLVSASTVFTLG